MIRKIRNPVPMNQTAVPQKPRLPLFHSIGAKLFISVLSASCVALGSVSYLFYRALENQAKEEMASRLNAQVSLVESQILQTETYVTAFSASLKELQRQSIQNPDVYQQLTLEYFKHRPALTMAIGFGQAPSQILPDRQWYWPYFFEHRGLSDALGQNLPAPNQDIRYADLTTDNYPNQDYYKLPLQAGKPIWTEPYPWYGVTMTSFMYPFFNQQNKLIGVIGADVNVTALTKLTQSSVLRKGGYFTLLSQTGTLLAYPPDPKKAEKKVSYQQIPALKIVWQRSQTQQAGLLDFDGNLWAYHKVNGTQWLMIAVVPKSLIIQPVLGYMLLSTGGAGIILLAVVTGFVWRLNRRLQPILAECHALRAADARGIADTHDHDEADSTKADSVHGTAQDELGILAATVHQVSRQLQKSFKLLEQSHEQLETRVEERSTELSQTLKELQETELQLVQNEKMSSLGQMMAGIAHEINNPVNFIHGNLKHADAYTQELLEAIALYQSCYPTPDPSIQSYFEKIDLAYVQNDLPKLMNSMKEGTNRIREIIISLRNFSRLDASEMRPVDLHDSLNSTLLILKHRLTAQAHRPEIQVKKSYGDLPLVECYGGLINQVLMNILANGIDVLDELALEHHEQDPDSTLSKPELQLHITTEAKGDEVIIRLADNGKGMDETTQAQLFKAFFTTKPIGKGTGLGLSISHQIIVEKHGGRLDCISAIGQGTEFVITLPLRTAQASGSDTSTAVPTAVAG
jgi:two-component system, NtrC family, sensor kinase